MSDFKQISGAILHWIIEDRTPYLVRPEGRYRLDNLKIIANGTKDLCIIRTKDGGVGIAKIEESSADEILSVPEYDIGIFEFDREVPGIGRFMIMDIDEELEPLITEMLRRTPGTKRKHYDAFLGKEYIKDYELTKEY